MPILAHEAAVHPVQLFDRPELGCEGDATWWALYTLARREKELMRRLRGLDIPFYGPLVARHTRSPGGRRRVAYVPLFAGYVFLYGDANARARALTTNCVSRWLAAPDPEDLTRDLRQIHRLIESDAPLTPEARLETGMRVRVRSGILEGVEGVIIKRANQARLLVAVNFIKQGASLLLEDHQFERVD